MTGFNLSTVFATLAEAIDAAERERGSESSRPRIKFVAVEEMLAAAQRA